MGEIIDKYEALLQQYEADLQAARNSARRNSYPVTMRPMNDDDEDTKTSEVQTSEVEMNTRKTFVVRDDEIDLDDVTLPLIPPGRYGRAMDDMEEMKAQLNADIGFYDRVERLFSDSTLMWALPMTK